MSAKKRRATRVPAAPPVESEKVSAFDQMDSTNLSSIDKASFLAGLQINYGNPLHSTAMEEDLNVPEEEQSRPENPGKVTGGQCGSAVKRNVAEEVRENRKEEKKVERGRRSAGEKGQTRPVNNQQRKEDKKRKSESASGSSSDSQSQSSGPAPQKSRRVLSSDEEDVDVDSSWNPSPKKAVRGSLGRMKKSLYEKSKARKSSSGSGSGEPEQASTGEQRRKKRGQHRGTELEVLLDSFLDFCEQYRESVGSKAVRHTIDCFSSNVKDQLTEKITSLKELKVLKRENNKVGSLIRKNTQRLFDAKHEMMRAERQAWLLEKEKAELQQRLADLRRSQAFLHDIRELNRQYLDYRQKHPKEKETYGASSLPALLLETKHIKTTERKET
ncbi:centromere protein U isoform X2 [Simochromis diagramma]|uniref:centromere protein U isoform X2 n=1 Tax=Simochromis diagramma TaxID=43689 RepID=UPI001A7EC697|nr:centromere protein U isoform X2 [Simochromis diagramma]